jgi:3-oxosteroid 1-dehydrogenase
VITHRPSRWDRVADVVVLGSGAAGLAAATLAHDGGADVVLLEKADLIGGTTGVSGGMPWIPLNRHMADVGVTDSRDEALTYIRRLTLGREPDPALVETYVDTAPEMLDYLEAKTPLRMTAGSAFNDYYAHLPGGKMKGRSIEPAPFDAHELGEWAPRLRTSPHLPWLTLEEGARFLRGEAVPDMELAGRRQAEDVRVLGPALVASLFKGLLDRGVEVHTGAAASDLVVEDGAVIGVQSAAGMIGARRGVVLACGGFEWNEEMVRGFIGERIEPMSPPQNEGDGIRMAMEAGALLGNMRSFWGQPGINEPGFEIDGRAVPQMGSVRSTPGVIVVNRHGKRFVNEAVTYQDFPKSIGTFDPVAVEYPNEAPHWIVFDQGVKDSAVVLPTVLPGQPAPSWVLQAPTLAALAREMGVDAGALEATVATWNAQVGAGEDPDFSRGTTMFEVHMSGRQPSPATCMRAVERAPFYAVPLVNGALGTNGGAVIDACGRVRRMGGGVVPGLYAAGNATASVFGPAYPGGGATIGPALTFGYIAGRHAAAQPSRTID